MQKTTAASWDAVAALKQQQQQQQQQQQPQQQSKLVCVRVFICILILNTYARAREDLITQSPQASLTATEAAGVFGHTHTRALTRETLFETVHDFGTC